MIPPLFGWWQKSDIWSQASYRYPISWEAFFEPSDFYFLFAKERGYHRWALAHSSSCSKKKFVNGRGGDEKCTYMFNVYKNQQSRHTGSRNLMGSKTLPTIWGTYIWSLWPNIRSLPSILAERYAILWEAFLVFFIINILVNTLGSTSFNGFWPNLVHI
jgi:hypothetical protein